MITLPRQGNRDISIVICGAAGQGVQTVEELAVRMLKGAGFNVFGSREYMSRVRGGNNSTEIRVSSGPVKALVDRIDILIPLNRGVRPNIVKRIDTGTVIFGDSEEVGEEFAGLDSRFISIPFLENAREVGGKVYSSIVATGLIAGLFGVNVEGLKDYFDARFGAEKGEEVVLKNMDAMARGFGIGKGLETDGLMAVRVDVDPSLEGQIVMNGTNAVALGAIAGGCNMVTAYPMSPATGVLTFMAKNAARFGLAVEQVEDEIAAINMAVGGSYAGARPLVSTSGGGFALMAEGLSLAAVMETPVVIHVAQRPGPATGMATRTEQADLDLVVYSGHGEFPRIVFAPGTLEEAFYLTQKAFNLAARFQSPVLILMDQYFVNSFSNLFPFDLSGLSVEKHLVEASDEYRRFEVTGDGISLRSVPGFGTGIVGADSHEHDDEGHVWEDFDLRQRMNSKRLRKGEGIQAEALPPSLTGPKNYRKLVVCWGSTRPIVEEAVAGLDSDDVAVLHFAQVHPLHPDTARLLEKAEDVVIVEGNATGQLARHIRTATGYVIAKKVLHFNGLQLSVEDARERIAPLLG